MRLLVLISILGSSACTRTNPSYGETGGTDEVGDDDPSRASIDESASVGEEADASAEGQSSIDTGPEEESSEETGATNSCCFAHSDVGCETDSIMGCVCEGMASCCEIEWSEDCVLKAVTFCNAECQVDEEGSFETSSSTLSEGTSDGEATGSSTDTGVAESSTTGGSLSNCCAAHDGGGCDDSDIEDCVCITNKAPECCAFMWSEACVADAVECGATCIEA